MTILHAITWVAEAWKKVTSDTIEKCFRKAGILKKNFEVIHPLVLAEECDPFTDLDNDPEDAVSSSHFEYPELSDLVFHFQGSEDAWCV